MIQRVQTIFLLLATALLATTLFVPLAELNSETASYLLDATGVETLAEKAQSVYPTWAVFAVLAVGALLPLETIFLYKNRALQIRVCLLNAALILVFYLLFLYYWSMIRTELAVTTSFLSTLCMPVAALALIFMAIRRIRNDEKLIRSADRIRSVR